MTRAEWDAMSEADQQAMLRPFCAAMLQALERRRSHGLPTHDTLFLIYSREVAEGALGPLPHGAAFVMIPLEPASQKLDARPQEDDTVTRQAYIALGYDHTLGPRAVLVLADETNHALCHALPMHFPRLSRGGTA